MRFSHYCRCGVVSFPGVWKGVASCFFNLIYAEMPVFLIISSIGSRSIMISTLAWGVFLVIVVVDLFASLSRAFSFFSC